MTNNHGLHVPVQVQPCQQEGSENQVLNPIISPFPPEKKKTKTSFYSLKQIFQKI